MERLAQLLLATADSEANLKDIMVVIGDKTISNYLHGVTVLPVDFTVTTAI